MGLVNTDPKILPHNRAELQGTVRTFTLEVLDLIVLNDIRDCPGIPLVGMDAMLFNTLPMGGGTIVFVTGGARARAHYLIDAGDGEPPRWQATPAADTAPVPSAGYFSVASVPHGFIAVGGDYEQPDPSRPPSGCRYRLGCLSASDRCASAVPVEVSVGSAPKAHQIFVDAAHSGPVLRHTLEIKTKRRIARSPLQKIR